MRKLFQKIRTYDGQRVILLSDIDRIHRVPRGTARMAFKKKLKCFHEGEDYYVIDPLIAKCDDELGIEKNKENPDNLVLLTKLGYIGVAQDINLSWNEERKLVKNYFRYDFVPLHIQEQLNNMESMIECQQEQIETLLESIPLSSTQWKNISQVIQLKNDKMNKSQYDDEIYKDVHKRFPDLSLRYYNQIIDYINTWDEKEVC